MSFYHCDIFILDFSCGGSIVGFADEMIQDRRKEQKKELQRGPKKATAADKSVATGRAKREAANKARRGLTTEKKPTKMEVEKEVERQTQTTQTQKKKKEQKQTQGRMAPDSTGRSAAKREKKKTNNNATTKVGTDPPAAVFGGRVPPKKAIEAAIKGMEDAGFTIPTGHQMVMTFVPVPVAAAPAATEAKTEGTKGKTNNGNKGGPKNGGGGGTGGGGRGSNNRRGTGGGGQKKN